MDSNSTLKKRKPRKSDTQKTESVREVVSPDHTNLLKRLKHQLNAFEIENKVCLVEELDSFKEFQKLLRHCNEKKNNRSLAHIVSANWDIILLCIINVVLILYLTFFIASYIAPEADFTVSFFDFNEKIYKNMIDKWIKFNREGDVKNEQCAIPIPQFALPLFKPIDDCRMCQDLNEIKRIERVSKEEFLEKYAYSGVPVIITDAMTNWTGLTKINFDFLKQTYIKSDEIAYRKRQAKLANSKKLRSIIGTFKSIVETDEIRQEDKDTCQFFPYKTNFRNLREVFELETNNEKIYEKPWYVGWSNCNSYASEVLREHYERPYFLPEESEMSRLDWIFMGTPEYGAAMHIDDVNNPSWQAQISGIKLWTFKPPAECILQCDTLYVDVYPGDVIVFDSNRWYHATFIKGEEISLTIGSEYD